MRILSICLALAAGEFAASYVSTCAESWPVALVLALLVALFGHGFAVRGWSVIAVFFVGAALFLGGSVESERFYRERPWMRGAERWRQKPRELQEGMLQKVRRDLAHRVAIGLAYDHEVVALNRAILLGERKALPGRTRQVFVESGTMHVFAISGLHVMAVAKVLSYLLALLCVPRRFVGMLALPVLWGYVCLIGGSPSAVRAALMAMFYYSAPVFWRCPNGLRSWALTFLAVHLVNPTVIVNVGNALSFAVMLAIILVGDAVRRLGGWRAAMLVTGAAWAAGVPIAAHVFGRVTPGGMLANLVLIFAATGTVVSGVIGVLVSFVSETVAAHFNNFAALVTRAMVGLAEVVARLPGSNFEVEKWSCLQGLGWYAAIGLIAFLAVRRRRRIQVGF